ncbi:MAG: hypothetical protein SVX38_16090, partial [Chloroflexota bacterium]|nr:hypothetical protein [Chloroflexota bacterium]
RQIEEPHRLQSGERISIGDVELSYTETVTEQPPAPAYEAESAPAAPVAAPVTPAKKKGGVPKWVWIGCAALLILGLLVVCTGVVFTVVIPQLQ